MEKNIKIDRKLYKLYKPAITPLPCSIAKKVIFIEKPILKEELENNKKDLNINKKNFENEKKRMEKIIEKSRSQQTLYLQTKNRRNLCFKKME